MKTDDFENDMSRGEKLLAEAMAFYFDRKNDDFLEPVDDSYLIGYDSSEDSVLGVAAEDESPYSIAG